jgi:hypothetical protein
MMKDIVHSSIEKSTERPVVSGAERVTPSRTDSSLSGIRILGWREGGGVPETEEVVAEPGRGGVTTPSSGLALAVKVDYNV